MPIFNFIETFFFISLGISFILIVLLVYHFKQRITTLEQKNDTMFEIINNIVKEITAIKSNVFSSHTIRSPYTMDFFKCPVDGNRAVIDELNKIEDDEEEEDEDEEDEEDEDEEDEDEEDIDTVILNQVSKIVVNDDDLELNMEDDTDITPIKTININIDSDKHEETELDLFIQKTENSARAETSKDMYTKMSITALKSLVVEKGICADPSKMKKNELIKMLDSV